MKYIYHFSIVENITGDGHQGLYHSYVKIDNDTAYKNMLVDFENKLGLEPDSFRFNNFSYLHSKDEL